MVLYRSTEIAMVFTIDRQMLCLLPLVFVHFIAVLFGESHVISFAIFVGDQCVDESPNCATDARLHIHFKKMKLFILLER